MCGPNLAGLRQEQFDEVLTELKNFLWLDEYTRAIIISFSIYNGNYNLYADCKFVMAFTPGGTIVPTYSFRILKFDIYENVVDLASALQSQSVR